MTKDQINRIGYVSAALTFLVATIIIIGNFFGFKGDFESWGLKFIGIALVSNILVIIIMYILASIYKIKGYFRSINYMLGNIPVALIYLSLAIWLMGYFRITIINDTNHSVSDIELYGCENENINRLEPGQNETVWIIIPHDCSIRIKFSDSKGSIKNDVVIGCLSSLMGGVDDYHLSGKNNPKY
ncbi:MAG: hypothetical protein WED10_09370 [Brumimicrobium sp.]